MNKNYIYLTLLLIVLAGGLFLLPEKENYQHMDPEDLMWSIVQPTRYVSTDQVAKRIIEGDPTLELIDVRTIDEFEEFSLQGAINIPIDSIMVPEYQDYLGIEDMSAVFYSDDDIKADQAWVLAKRLGYDHIYVMKGGLNCWIRTIIKPERPASTAAASEFELYSFRRGASMYFTGAEIAIPDDEGKQKVQVARKKKTVVAEGGC